MRLLALETSGWPYTVALADDRMIYDVASSDRVDPGFDGIGGLVRKLLSLYAWQGSTITHIAVNAGPGNLTSVRAGLAYANGLAFAVGASIHYSDSLAILSYGAKQQVATDIPILVLFPARRGDRPFYFTGLFTPNCEKSFGLRGLAEIKNDFEGSSTELIVVTAKGAANEPELLQWASKVRHCEVARPDAAALAAMFKAEMLRTATGPVMPITRESAVFRDAS